MRFVSVNFLANLSGPPRRHRRRRLCSPSVAVPLYLLPARVAPRTPVKDNDEPRDWKRVHRSQRLRRDPPVCVIYIQEKACQLHPKPPQTGLEMVSVTLDGDGRE